MLKDSLFKMVHQASFDGEARAEVERIGELHARRFDVRPQLYALWLDSLCAAIKQHDPAIHPRWKCCGEAVCSKESISLSPDTIAGAGIIELHIALKYLKMKHPMPMVAEHPRIYGQSRVTILIPNYKTPEITKLCLRLIRKHTNPNRIRVLVIDNDSRDASTDYLRSLSWIDLIERRPAADDTPSLSHSRALDLALAQVKTPFVLSFHTDTFVRDDGWLDFLLGRIKKDPNIAGVGSWKLENQAIS